MKSCEGNAVSPVGGSLCLKTSGWDLSRTLTSGYLVHGPVIHGLVVLLYCVVVGSACTCFLRGRGRRG